MLTAEETKHTYFTGLCPPCKKSARAKDGKALDPAIYAECQRISALEKELFPRTSGQRMLENVERYEREAFAGLKRLGVNPLEAEALLGFQRPAAKSGKVGGPSGRDGA